MYVLVVHLVSCLWVVLRLVACLWCRCCDDDAVVGLLLTCYARFVMDWHI